MKTCFYCDLVCQNDNDIIEKFRMVFHKGCYEKYTNKKYSYKSYIPNLQLATPCSTLNVAKPENIKHPDKNINLSDYCDLIFIDDLKYERVVFSSPPRTVINLYQKDGIIEAFDSTIFERNKTEEENQKKYNYYNDILTNSKFKIEQISNPYYLKSTYGLEFMIFIESFDGRIL